MSADYWLLADTGGPEKVQVFSTNVTYNLGEMLRAAGFPAWRALIDAPASETGGMLRKVADTLRADPAKFKVYNPPNGWGTYEIALKWADEFADACAAHPNTVIGGWL